MPTEDADKYTGCVYQHNFLQQQHGNIFLENDERFFPNLRGKRYTGRLGYRSQRPGLKPLKMVEGECRFLAKQQVTWKNVERPFSDSPTCKPKQINVYGVAKQERAQISCQVDANPPDIQFKWTFNNSADLVDVAQSHIVRSGTSSIVSYTPMTELDYGTLLCYARNKIGTQRVPCVFHIIAAGEFFECF
ncbi:hypothetical protein WA026_007887 [Henosepilachna vigintioctopunctata]|uniref:Ig-like domain-containing protein n=1 Tax=Henosepilachna vigintioctopunctata TaxID=420089 RepID=A0AAW1U4K6_9CUCU